VLKTKTFIINVAVVGVLTITAITLSVFGVFATGNPDDGFTGESRLQETRIEVEYGTYRYFWKISVVGNENISWETIYADYQLNNNILRWSFTYRSKYFSGNLVPTSGGLAFSGVGTFTATITYKNYSTVISL
jgi:hypothetical protein